MTETTDETHASETDSGTRIEDMGRQAVLDAQYLVQLSKNNHHVIIMT